MLTRYLPAHGHWIRLEADKAREKLVEIHLDGPERYFMDDDILVFPDRYMAQKVEVIWHDPGQSVDG